MSGGNREHGEHGNESMEHVDLVAISRAVCTESQLEVIYLRETGLGWKAIALVLGVGPDAVRDRHRRAIANVMKEMQRVEALRRDSAGSA